MVDREELKQDIARVNGDVEDELSPLRYRLGGNYSLDEVRKEFGSWEDALERLDLTRRDKIIQDIQQTFEDSNRKVTRKNYESLSGKFSIGQIREEFGTWGNAKEESGFNRNAKRVTDKQLEDDMKRVAEKIERPLSTNTYEKHGKFSPGVFNNRDISFADFRDNLGLESPDPGNPSKEILEAWADELQDVRGWFSVEDLKEKLSDSGYKYNTLATDALKKHLKANGFEFNISHGNGSKYYIQGPELDSYENMYGEYLEKIPEEGEEWFRKMTGTGTSPRTLVATIRYLTEDITQKEAGDKENVSEVSIRNARKKMIDKLGLSEDIGKEEQDTDQAEDDEDQITDMGIQEEIPTRDLDISEEEFRSLNLSKLGGMENKSNLLRTIFSLNGFQVQGEVKDLHYRAMKDGEEYLIAVDDSARVSSEFIHECIEMVDNRGFDELRVVSFGFFTESARHKAQEAGCDMINRQQFVEKLDEAKSKFKETEANLDINNSNRSFENLEDVISLSINMCLNNVIEDSANQEEKARYLSQKGLSASDISIILDSKESKISGYLN